MRAMITKAAHRKKRNMSLLILHRQLMADCESTVFSVIPNTGKVHRRCPSRDRRFIYDQSSFGPEIRSECGTPAFYIGLHKQRFHIVIDTDSLAAAYAIREAIQTEEDCRQKLDLISRDMTAINAMSVTERSEYESQYKELETVLASLAQKLVGNFSSICWIGTRNSFELQTLQSADPCLLCKAGLQHTIRVLRVDMGTTAGDVSATEASFASWPAAMVMKAVKDGTEILV
jgi:hypothetical protein